MIKLPGQTKRHSVSNTSDLFGTLEYTKNINLDEAGYIKLSPRSMLVLTERTDVGDADVGLPLALGRSGSLSSLSFYVVTSNRAFTLSIATSGLSATQDASSPQYTLDSHGRWFHNLWITSEDNDIYSGSGNSYTDIGNLTTGKAHPVEVFRNRNTICFGDGNQVLQYTESGGSLSASQTLTLPADFEVVKLAYANNKMGVLTILSDTVSGQNQEAYFFVWDGATASAEQGLPIGSETGVDVVAYKGSFVILTRTGQLLFYTGGGFQELAAFPFKAQDVVWENSYVRNAYGDILKVSGDRIFINFDGIFAASGSQYEVYNYKNPGGVWCYDPQIGLYHRYAPSLSLGSVLTVPQANVSTTTDILTASAGTISATGSPVKYVAAANNQIGGLQTGTVYYCIRHNSTQFSLAASKDDATNGVKINLTSTGATNNYFLGVGLLDYGQFWYNNRPGTLALTGGKTQMFDLLAIGAALTDYDSSTGAASNTLSLTCGGFEARGYFVTAKMQSPQIQDKGQKIYVKYRPLDTDDAIVVKIKSKDVIGLPISSMQERVSNRNQCTWTAADTFTTTVDFSDAKTAFDAGVELECEVIAGAGAGSLAKISDITYSSGTYTVTLAEDVDGAASGRYCDVLIENWTVLGTITSDDVDGYKSFNVESSSTWHKFKVELRGVNTTVEEIDFVTSVHQPAV